MRAYFVAADGSRFTGFLSPSESSESCATTYLHLFAGAFTIGFWASAVPGLLEFRARLYETTGKSAKELFPLRGTTSSGLVDPPVEVVVEGFYSIESFGARPTIGY